jgi:hypothetical protein
MPEEKEIATVTIKVRPSTHQEIRLLAAELMVTNAEAVDYAVRRMRAEVAKERQREKG